MPANPQGGNVQFSGSYQAPATTTTTAAPTTTTSTTTTTTAAPTTTTTTPSPYQALYLAYDSGDSPTACNEHQ